MSDNMKSPREGAITSIASRHLPSLYQSADQASLSAQQQYLRLQKGHISCLILGSVGAALTAIVPVAAVTWTYAFVAIILLIGVTLAWVSRIRRDDKVWFDCRAIAESTKTAAWRLMMRAAPFKDEDTARKSFIGQLQRIRKARPSSAKDLAQNLDAEARSISDFMDDTRRKSADERRGLYLELRLRDQKTWYSNKAKLNSKMEGLWFWAVVILQMLAVTAAFIRISSTACSINVVPILMTCAASAIAWSQTKRYGELTQAYSLAAQELGDQEEIALSITEEEDLLTLVEQVEETISREHTMWHARREAIGPADKRN